MTVFSELLKNRHIAFFLARREVERRYRGSFLGIVWIFLPSLLTIAIYTFVFSVIFVSRWPGLATDRIDAFAVVLFAGLSLYGLASECWSRAATLIVDNATYVTKVVFPLWILPVSLILAASFQLLVNLAILFVLRLMVFGIPSVTILALPLIIVPYFILVLGVTYIFATLGTFVRDLSQIMPIALTALLFLSPILYPVSNTPASIRFVFNLNPMTIYFEDLRAVFFADRWPDFFNLAVASIVAAVVLYIGIAVFRRGSRAFADVL